MRSAVQEYSQQVIRNVCAQLPAVINANRIRHCPTAVQLTAEGSDLRSLRLRPRGPLTRPFSTTEAPTRAQRCHSTHGGNTLWHGKWLQSLSAPVLDISSVTLCRDRMATVAAVLAMMLSQCCTAQHEAADSRLRGRQLLRTKPPKGCRASSLSSKQVFPWWFASAECADRRNVLSAANIVIPWGNPDVLALYQKRLPVSPHCATFMPTHVFSLVTRPPWSSALVVAERETCSAIPEVVQAAVRHILLQNRDRGKEELSHRLRLARAAQCGVDALQPAWSGLQSERRYVAQLHTDPCF